MTRTIIFEQLLSRFADTVGDGSGTIAAVGNYSGAAEQFLVAPGSTESFSIARMIVHLVDVGAFDADAYGNNIALTNGIGIWVEDDGGVLYRLTPTGSEIKTNGDWAGYCHDFTEHGFGVGNVHGTARWTFAASGSPVVLLGSESQRLVVELEDDFSGLVKHQFLVQGFVS